MLDNGKEYAATYNRMRGTTDKAYDYKAQRWVEGEDATAILEAQMMDEIELLAGDDGENFAMMIGVNRKDQLEKTVRCLRASLAARLTRSRETLARLRESLTARMIDLEKSTCYMCGSLKCKGFCS